MSKFSDFLQGNKIDSRRITASSAFLERLRPEDRASRLKLRQAKGKEGGAVPAADGAAKRRSGRPVTPQLLKKALEGKPVTGPAKTRLLRAVNRLLEQKKKDPVD